MSTIRVTVRAEITGADGTASVVERALAPDDFGDNPLFFADVVEQAAEQATGQVKGALETLHGKAPRRANVRIV